MATSWGFESPLPHQFKSNKDKHLQSLTTRERLLCLDVVVW